MTRRRDARRRVGSGYGAVLALALLGSILTVAPQATAGVCDGYSTIDTSLLPTQDQLRTWMQEEEDFGVRSTGSPSHEAYIDLLAGQLATAGVSDVHREPFTVDRWIPASWSLDVIGGASVPVAGPVPFSGETPAAGVTGPLVSVSADPAPGSLTGKIAVIDVPVPDITAAQFYANAAYVHDPNLTMTPAYPYKRTWIGPLLTTARLVSAAKTAGAVGFIGVLDLPADFASGLYVPFSGEVQGLPGLYLDRDRGRDLRQTIRSGPASARLVLTVSRETATTGNLVGTIPGLSDETIILLSHTDGTSALWDNGPAGILAIASYFAAIPLQCRPRTIEVVLTSGHLYGAKGAGEYIAAHDANRLEDTVAVLTLEHFGATEWLEGTDGRHHPTGQPEPAGLYVSESTALLQEGIALAQRETLERTFVSHAWFPRTAPKPSPSFPGEGSKYHMAGVPALNYVTGPTYLLSSVATMDKIDFALAYRVVRGFTQLTQNVGTIPAELLRGAAPVRRTLHKLGAQ